VTATAQYAGTCPAASAPLGTANPRSLAWTDLNGSATFQWSVAVADCTERVCVYAAGAEDTVESCAELTYAPQDLYHFSFEPMSTPEDWLTSSPGYVHTIPITMQGFEGSIPLTITSIRTSTNNEYVAINGVFSGSGGADNVFQSNVTPGTTIKLQLYVPAGEHREVVFSVPGHSATLVIN